MTDIDVNEAQRKKPYMGLIPFNVLFDLDLNANHLRFYGQIQQMENHPNPEVEPTFSFEWIGELLGINRRNARNIANTLKNKGYILHTKRSRYVYVWSIVRKQVIENRDSKGSLGDLPDVSKCNPGGSLGDTSGGSTP